MDELVFPDGRVIQGVLGGGGPQAAFGMRLFSAPGRVGILSGVGADFPDQAQQWLDDAGIDTGGLRRNDLPTTAARQVISADGSVKHEWLTPPAVFQTQLRRDLASVPAAFRGAQGFHLGVHPLEGGLEFVRALKTLNPDQPALISLETFRPAARTPTAAELTDLLAAGDIFSPNMREAVSLVGHGAPEEVAQRLLDGGAQVVALRLGARGSLIACRECDFPVGICAVPVQVVSPLGAGNAYCGGFLAGWLKYAHLPVAQRMTAAGVCGAVAASFLIEQPGLPAWQPDLTEEAHRRMEMIS